LTNLIKAATEPDTEAETKAEEDYKSAAANINIDINPDAQDLIRRLQYWLEPYNHLSEHFPGNKEDEYDLKKLQNDHAHWKKSLLDLKDAFSVFRTTWHKHLSVPGVIDASLMVAKGIIQMRWTFVEWQQDLVDRVEKALGKMSGQESD
jgi:hypothetical protein